MKSFNDAKGCGLTTHETGGGDIFIHYSYFSAPSGSGDHRSLHEGQRVQFDVVIL